MGDIERSTDDVLGAISNLRGYRCAEQGPFLAHVEVVYQDVIALVTQHRGAVEALREIAALPHNGATDSRAVAAERGRIARAALGRLGGQ